MCSSDLDQIALLIRSAQINQHTHPCARAKTRSLQIPRPRAARRTQLPIAHRSTAPLGQGKGIRPRNSMRPNKIRNKITTGNRQIIHRRETLKLAQLVCRQAVQIRASPRRCLHGRLQNRASFGD